MSTLTKTLLGDQVAQVHEVQKYDEKDLSFTDKEKLRLAKKGNWITILSLIFAIKTGDPTEIFTSAEAIFQWFF